MIFFLLLCAYVMAAVVGLRECSLSRPHRAPLILIRSVPGVKSAPAPCRGESARGDGSPPLREGGRHSEPVAVASRQLVGAGDEGRRATREALDVLRPPAGPGGVT